MTEKIKQFKIEKIGDPETPFAVIYTGGKYNQELGEFETKKEAEHYIYRLINYKLLFCKKCEVKFIETMKTDVFYCPCCGKFFKQDKNIMKEISKEIGYCNETEKKLKMLRENNNFSCRRTRKTWWSKTMSDS